MPWRTSLVVSLLSCGRYSACGLRKCGCRIVSRSSLNGINGWSKGSKSEAHQLKSPLIKLTDRGKSRGKSSGRTDACMRRIGLELAIRRLRTLLLLCLLSVSLSNCGKNHAIDLYRSDVNHQQSSPDIRVMSWNVKRNSILPPDGVRHESF